ncbi:M48 family metalloprotease [Nostoc sp. FACHB-87]|uniref:M48 family metallopeptidase n=1 Tax=Nostocaceae TaxID=1162 RepID=UPI0016890E42|nr:MULTISPECIES: M48 family metallopeptidase [Nostocaceae]MBD2453102.1 M48 family metalloprotease [Nostoc sp. FACHB-87]MBD2475118.1 M48 family metalloprotease [Anabaena sp. FACHB-83]
MTRAFPVAQAVKLSLILGVTTGSCLLGSNFKVHAESGTGAHRQPQITSVKLAQNSSAISRFQTFAEADELYQKGQLQAAENLYRKVKSEFAASDRRRTAIYEVDKLPGDGQVYWRNANEGLQQNLDSKIFLPLQLLLSNYPEFIKGHLLLAEACQNKPEACKNSAKDGQPKNALEVLERAVELYPDEPELLKAKINALEKEQKFLEASIAARQFATIYVDYPEAPEFEQLAEKNLQRHHSKLNDDLRFQGIFSAVVGGVKAFSTKDWQAGVSGFETVSMLLQGESAFGKEVADKLVKQYQQEGKLLEDPQVLNYVRGIGGRLEPLMGRKFDYEYYVIQDSSINAFALPGGKVFVNTGAILAANSEAELAGLLSHELAHAVLSHGFQRVAQGKFISSLSNVIPMPDMLQEMVGKEHSRENERQADILGTRVLTKAGYAADGLRNLMATLNAKSGGKSETSWQSTHPAPAERVTYLENLIQSNNYNRYAFEGVKKHKEIQDLIQGVTPSIATTNPGSQPDEKPPKANLNPGSKPTRGVVAIASGQTRDNVEIRIDGGKVESNRNFTINFIVENRSDRPFAFVPLYAEVVTESGKKLKTRFSSAQAQVPAKGTIKGEVQVLGQTWNSQGSQNLTLVIKESTGGGRIFRIPF